MAELHAWLEFKNPSTNELSRVALPDHESILIGGIKEHPVTVSGKDTRFILSDSNAEPITYLNRRLISQAELTNLDEIQIGNAAYIFRAAYIEAPGLLNQPLRISSKTSAPLQAKSKRIYPQHLKTALNATASALLIGIYAGSTKADMAVTISLCVLLSTLGLLGTILLGSIFQKSSLERAIENATNLTPLMLGTATLVGLLCTKIPNLNLVGALTLTFLGNSTGCLTRLKTQTRRLAGALAFSLCWTTLMAPLILAALTTRGQ